MFWNILRDIQTLLEQGYTPSFLSVAITHTLRPTPQHIDDLVDPAFLAHIATLANKYLETALAEADLVVINGEGTLHGLGPGPRNLLFMGVLAKSYFKKPMYLINHSSYPSDHRHAEPEADAFYAATMKDLDSIVAREIYSHEILTRLRLSARLGFDSLPRFIMRHKTNIQMHEEMSYQKARPLLVSGGVDMPEHVARSVAKSVDKMRNQGQEIIFLTGAKRYPADEDGKIFKWMHEEVPDLLLVAAGNFEEWTQVIGKACCLISGRFHHTIAAATLGTPVVTLLCRTPKISGIAEMLGLAPPIGYDDPNLGARIIHNIEHAIATHHIYDVMSSRTKMLSLAEENYRDF